jgi:polysaccharide export outer membrane protein
MDATPFLRAGLLCLAVLVPATQPIAAQSQPQRPPTPTPSTQANPALDDDYRIGPEDVLNVVVLGNPDYTRTVPVRPDGRISLPGVNDVMAAGLTPMELRLVLIKGFEKFIKEEVLEVSVIVTEVHSVKVSVQGNVRTPIRFELRSRANVLDALSMAGGFNDFAKRDRILIRRADGSTATFNYDRFLERPDSTEIIVLRGGDNIIVP